MRLNASGEDKDDTSSLGTELSEGELAMKRCTHGTALDGNEQCFRVKISKGGWCGSKRWHEVDGSPKGGGPFATVMAR